MRRLVCDALIAVWMALTTPVRKLVSDAIAEAREAETRRALAASLCWTDKDDQALDDYSREPE